MKIVKFFLKFVLIVLLALAIIWSALAALLGTKKGQEWIIANAVVYLERETGLLFIPEKIELVLPLGMRIHNLTISDVEQKLTTIGEIDLFCLYPALFEGRIICSSLHAKEITLFSTGKKSSSTESFNHRPLPFYLKIENLHLEQIRLSPHLLQQLNWDHELEQFSFDLQGMVSNNPLKQSGTAHLLLTATHLTHTYPPISLGINAQNNLLSFSLHANQLPIPETTLKSNLALFASGNFSSWQQLAQKSSLTDHPIKGHFKWEIPVEQAVIKSQYQIHSLTEIDLFEMMLTAPHLDIQGQSRLSLDGIEQGSFQGKFTESDQEIALQGSVAGPYGQLALSMQADSSHFNFGKYLIENIRSTLDTTIRGKQAEGSIKLDFESNKIPCHAASTFEWDKANDKLHFPHLAIDALQSHLEGDLTVSILDLILEGYLQGHSVQLQPIAQLADLSMEGETDFKLLFKPVQDAGTGRLQGIDCDLDGKNIRYHHIQIGQLAMRSQYPSGEIQFAVKEAKNGPMIIDDLSGESSLSVSELQWPFKLRGKGELEDKWDLDAEGVWHFDLQSIEFHLMQLQGFYGTSPLELLMPMDYIYYMNDSARASMGFRWGGSELKGIFASEKENFNLNIEAEGRLDAYLQLLVQDAPNLSGQAKMVLQISGNRAQPSVHGSLDIFDATYESQNTGAIYRNIRAHLEGNGSRVLLKSLVADDSQGGTISGDGSIQIISEQNFPYEFHIQASQLYVLNSDYASISASGPLSLTGNTKKAKLSGTLKVEHAVVHLEEALPKQIKTVDIRYINMPEGLLPPIPHKEAGLVMELDVILAAQEIQIEGNHLQSTWKGEITIAGTSNQPLLFGDLRVSKGEYDLNSKTFSLNQGSIHFAGAADKKTTLYVVASKEIDPIKAEMIVKGPLNKLEVSFRSNPPLSQRDVLSYILFGRGISEITTGEGNTLNQSFIALNASEQSSQKQDLLTRLRNNIGIDRLDFTAAGEGENQDVALQVGKYVWDDVFISINKSIGASADRIAIEAKLMKNVKAQAEVDIGSSSQGKVSLKWKRDY